MRIRFHEQTGVITPHTFNSGGPELTAQLATLSPSSFDFNGLSNENYDVFYSDALGNFDVNGDCLTVIAVYPTTSGGGGLNINQIDFLFSGGGVRAAGILKSFFQSGTNAVPGSELNAVDGLLNTTTTMGNTAGSGGTPLRITVGLVPEPSTYGLVGIALVVLGASVRRRRLSTK